MATSQGVNVLRYSALAAGIFYGVYHQASLSAKAKLAQIDREYNHKESLIQKAKAEYVKKTLPAEAKTASGDIIMDVNDKNFDFEAFLTKMSSES